MDSLSIVFLTSNHYVLGLEPITALSIPSIPTIECLAPRTESRLPAPLSSAGSAALPGLTGETTGRIKLPLLLKLLLFSLRELDLELEDLPSVVTPEGEIDILSMSRSDIDDEVDDDDARRWRCILVGSIPVIFAN